LGADAEGTKIRKRKEAEGYRREEAVKEKDEAVTSSKHKIVGSEIGLERGLPKQQSQINVET
jgi:hypothetical protein